MAEQKEEFLTYSQFAERLTAATGVECTPEWVRDLGERGTIRVSKFSPRKHRILASELTRYISTMTTGATSGENQEAKAAG